MSYPVPEHETRRIAALKHYRLLDTPQEKSFDDIAMLASQICGTPMSMVTLVDEKRQWFKAKVGGSETETPRETSFCAHAIMSKQLMIVEDATKDARFAKNPQVTSNPNIRFYAGAPLVDRDGFGLGSLCVIDREPRRLTPDQKKALEALAHQVVLLFQYRRISSELAEALENVKLLSGLLPICGHCKNIRDDRGYWNVLEEYISSHSSAGFSHGICPTCIQSHYPDMYSQLKTEGKI